MPANSEVIMRLRALGQKLEKWRKDAQGFRRLTDEAVATKKIDEGQLLELERTAGDIYDEIAIFNKLVPEIAVESPNAAAELAAVGEALQLVLLDITETGTRMYSVRSALTDGAQIMHLNQEEEMADKIKSEAPPPPPPSPPSSP